MRFPLLLLACAALSLPGVAAAAAAPAPAGTPAPVSVLSIGDVRGGDASSRLEIELQLPDVRADEVVAARVAVTKAVDDTGRDLLPEDARKPPLETTPGAAGGPDDQPAPAVVTLKLRNPARRAKVLAEVAGVIELYLPGRDPAAVVTIPGIAARAGTPLEDPALAAAGVRIALLTEEQLAAENKRLAAERNEEARKRGPLGEMMGAMAGALIKAFFTPEPGDVVLKVDDPRGRVVRMALLDAAGEDRTTGWSRQQGLTLLSSTSRGPGADWSLRVHLVTPSSTLLRPFALEGVRLP